MGVCRAWRTAADGTAPDISPYMKFFPRSLATLTLAVAAVPGVAPLTVQAPVSMPAHMPAPVPMIPASTPGGWTDKDPNSADVRQAATFAVTVLGREFGHPYVVERLRAAASQVVDGVNYRIRMRIAEVDDSILGGRKDCTAFIWSRPWLKNPDVLTSFTCQALDDWS
jgi:Cystatin domain